MKSRFIPIILVIISFAVNFGFAAGTSSLNFPDASKDPKVTLSWGNTAAAEDLSTKGMERVAELIKERSGGSLIINTFPASQLGTAVTQMEMVIAGSIDIFTEGSNYMADFGVPDRNIASMYFQIPSMEHALKFINSDLYKSWEDVFLANTGLRTLASNWMRPPVVIASNVPLNTYEDFQGLKIRALPSKFTLAALESIGTNPTAVAYNEVYLALQQGIIDATIATRDAVYKMNFYQVSKYLLMYELGYVNFSVWMNENKFQSLTQAQQEILSKTCKEVGDWYAETVREELDSYVDEMVKHGIELINLPEEEIPKFRAATTKLIEQYEEDGTFSAGLSEKFFNALGLEK
ncbi:MAG: TRAP transporter substrate-binding protein [Atribacterota bacterium]|jgi:TRAP-type C4-dicarboxylate transport system substrate-binding protein|nr:TRAP transporter substrate-binding protein [Atribacterota bacterium]MDD4896050.1 TRAP transporter substrate-binding protein [Atribacterota bacterium]MDD5637125.1 TRAP transporter substrate-binding protein [Atribacterota bacterium]